MNIMVKQLNCRTIGSWAISSSLTENGCHGKPGICETSPPIFHILFRIIFGSLGISGVPSIW